MHNLILWAGFAGAWLLVAGPVQQAVIELSDEDLERDRFQQTWAAVEPAEPVSAWWWLLPPVRLYLGRRRRDRWQRDAMDALPDEDYEALTSFMAKARAWLIVGTGGSLIAAKETYELVEAHEWPLWLFWLLVVAGVLASVANAAWQSARHGRELERRRLTGPAGRTTTAPRRTP